MSRAAVTDGAVCKSIASVSRVYGESRPQNSPTTFKHSGMSSRSRLHFRRSWRRQANRGCLQVISVARILNQTSIETRPSPGPFFCASDGSKDVGCSA